MYKSCTGSIIEGRVEETGDSCTRGSITTVQLQLTCTGNNKKYQNNSAYFTFIRGKTSGINSFSYLKSYYYTKCINNNDSFALLFTNMI